MQNETETRILLKPMKKLYLNPYREKAEQGDEEAQYQLGLCYYTGEGENVVKDFESAARWFRKAAEQGHALGQYNLGLCYFRGNGLPTDKKEAVDWFHLSAERNCAEAQGILGFAYVSAQGIAQDWKKAFEWSRKAAEQGDDTGQFLLAVCYANGRGVTQDSKQAANWYRKAAEQNNSVGQYELNSVGQYELGQCYAKGQGVEKDDEEAVRWYRKAADLGLDRAQKALGDCYLNGCGVEKDEEEASKWHRKATEQDSAEEKSDVEEQDYIGLINSGWPTQGHFAELSKGAMATFKKINHWLELAENGDVDAQHTLVMLDEVGACDLLPEVKMEWLTNVAQQGIGEAQEMLADQYKHGGAWPLIKNDDEAEKWYSRAVNSYHKESEEGDEESQYRLGNCYFEGRGIDQNDEEAVRWYRKSADLGYSDAENVLGNCYLNGRGVEKDKREAWGWYRKAAEQGDFDSIEILKKLFSEGNLIGTVTTPNGEEVEIFETAKAWHIPSLITDRYPEGIRISREFYKNDIPLDEGILLIEQGKTNLLSGFESKIKKRIFSCHLTLDYNTGRVGFELEPRHDDKKKDESEGK